MPSRAVYNRALVLPKSLIVVCAVLAAVLPGFAQGPFTESARLSSLYDTILAARFDAARTALPRACPPAPREACAALETAALWWQVQLDPNNRALDSPLEQAAGRAIESASRWTNREPRSAEAWFYLAGSYAPLVQWRVLRGQRLSAAREGLKIKDALEKAIALDPTMFDAYFGIGLYHYYAAVAPAAVKALRWLLLLPGGDREQGLREILQARDRGAILRGEADYQLHLLYLWYERQPARAIDLLRGLDTRYPSNPLFLQRIADIQRHYLNDHAASLETFRALLDRAAGGRVEFAAMTRVRAQIGIAQELLAQSDAARAVDALSFTSQSHPDAPFGADALARLTLGLAYERLGDRERAVAALNDAIAVTPNGDPDDIRSKSRAALARLRSQRAS
jgi:tetratricopeptide (TPR) repeat protein